MFRSFFMAGFECATGCDRDHQWFDQTASTQHDLRIMEDYTALYSLGIKVVREGVRWPLVDQRGQYDFASLNPFLTRARYVGMQLILDLFHDGYPTDTDPFVASFVDRFASYCRAVAQHVHANMDGPFFFTPVNEPSYFARAASDSSLLAPHCSGRSFELKVQLARAAIAGIDAIRSVIPTARMVNVDSVCRVVPPKERPDLQDAATAFNSHAVFESWDMLAGLLKPELGGSPEHLDIVGANYYRTNQWEYTRPDSWLSEDDVRWVPLQDLLRSIWDRYHREIVITATADVDGNRARHLERIADECEAVLNDGIPLLGACWYPILGMPTRNEPLVWTRMGLWDVDQHGTRRLYEPGAAALRGGQRRLENLAIPRDLQLNGPHLF